MLIKLVFCLTVQIYFRKITGRKSTLHRSVKYPVWRGHSVWLPSSSVCAWKNITLREKKIPPPYPLRLSDCGVSALICSVWGAEVPPQSSRIDRICAQLPAGVANTAQRKILRKRKRKNFLFSFPLSLVYLFAYLYAHLDSPPPPAGAWTGLDDTTRPIPRLLKGSRRWGQCAETHIAAHQRVNIRAWLCGLYSAACTLCNT